MIVTGSKSRENDIALLLKEACHFNDTQVRSWMLHPHDPSTVFCLYEGKRLIGLMKSLERTFFFHGKKAKTAFLLSPILLPEHDTAANRKDLWKAALNTAEKNCLLIFYREKNPDQPWDKTFAPVFHSFMYSIAMDGKVSHVPGIVRPAKSGDDLYGLYTSFIDLFDGCVKLNPEEFDQNLRFAKASQKKIMVHENGSQIDGLYIASAHKNRLQMETIFYTSPQALVQMIEQAAKVWSAIDVHVSGCENLGAVFGCKGRPEDALMVKIPNLSLFNAWQNANYQDFAQAFNSLNHPSWNKFV